MKPPQSQKTKGNSATAASEIKTTLQSKNPQNETATVTKNKRTPRDGCLRDQNHATVENIPSKIQNHIETSQSTCFANQLTGFNKIQASIKDICKQTLRGHSKVQKWKKRKSLVQPEPYSEPHQKPQTAPLSKI